MWEGGVHGVGFINSPLLGNHSYVSENFFHVTDWLPTLFRAAGGDPSTLKNQDGFDMFNMLMENGPAVRKEVLHNIDPVNKFAAVRVGDFKLVMGRISRNDNSWYPPPKVSEDGSESDAKLKFSSELKVSVGAYNHKYVPSASSRGKSEKTRNGHGSPIIVECGKKPLNASFNCVPEKSPCLFHIPSDPCEFNNVAAQHPDMVQQLLKRLDEYRATMVPPNNKPVDPNGNPFKHGGVWQPWL